MILLIPPEVIHIL